MSGSRYGTRLTHRIGCVLIGIAAIYAPIASAQVQRIDPDAGLQADIAAVPQSEAEYGTNVPPETAASPVATAPVAAPAAPVASAAPVAGNAAGAASGAATYQQQDIIAAAEGVFGKGAEGLAKLLEKVLKDQGEPNGYIAGREAGAAIAVGVRYGSGTLTHKIEGKMPVYWTGPSLGFDLGANGAKTFVLVYNLYDTQDLFKRYPAVEGNAYVVGGFTASYLRSGSVVLIPIRLGVGWRLGVNAGYMKFSKESRWNPF